MKVACCQFAPAYRAVEQNVDLLREMVRAADADIYVFPELALTGYFFKTREEIAPLAEVIDGELARAISEIAKSEKKAIITGFLEKDGERFYNSALAFDASGTLAGHYRKVHLFYYETRIFAPGDLGFPVFDLQSRSGVVRTGMLVCYDWRFPEAARSLALAGAELIAMPSNIVTTSGMLHTTLRTRAFENKVALAFSDRVGSETNADETLLFRGESTLINYNGEVLAIASADSSQTIVANFDLSKTREKQINPFNDIFRDRHPGGYGL